MAGREDIINALEQEVSNLTNKYNEDIKSLKNAINILKNKESNINLSNALTYNMPPADNVIETNTDKRKHSSTGISFNILEILKKEKVFLKSSEILKKLQSLYYEEEIDKKTLSFRMSNTLSYLKRTKKIISYKKGTSLRSVYWGLSNWLDAKGNIKELYKA